MANVAHPAVPSPLPSRLGIVPRVIMLTFGLTGISFAVSLFLGILGLVVVGIVRGHLPDMRLAYRSIALPVAAVVACVAFVSAWIMEIRAYRRAKQLNTNNLDAPQ